MKKVLRILLVMVALFSATGCDVNFPSEDPPMSEQEVDVHTGDVIIESIDADEYFLLSNGSVNVSVLKTADEYTYKMVPALYANNDISLATEITGDTMFIETPNGYDAIIQVVPSDCVGIIYSCTYSQSLQKLLSVQNGIIDKHKAIWYDFYDHVFVPTIFSTQYRLENAPTHFDRVCSQMDFRYAELQATNDVNIITQESMPYTYIPMETYVCQLDDDNFLVVHATSDLIYFNNMPKAVPWSEDAIWDKYLKEISENSEREADSVYNWVVETIFPMIVVGDRDNPTERVDATISNLYGLDIEDAIPAWY